MSYLIVKNLQTSGAVAKQSALRTFTTQTATTVSNTSATYVDTGLSLTLTPLSSSNRFLFFVTVPFSIGCNNAIIGGFRILRNATETYGEGASHGLNINYYHNERTTHQFSYVDSPATTSAITYKVQFYVPTNVGSYDQTMTVCYLNMIATMTIMEIAG
ncbi:hypothetical protein UFOVP909_146 [uncultured Caudovirales phage]|uniref:Uncharacterized protein n=1 Tax=uncultured Caudovirales phage TaxID=2100421 RepID=A0A6J5S155_9CAUD|nr:hypothetical protein UFOVP909_146 [uncultured Caudovirales phage]CAB4182058.1 hypothetical protein UFOVP1066_125 [uncultured Caudovirales phage]CAB4198685.1 hypothetical protein UFOVP1315_212 [uncultured Caudovirales phage]CAB4211566.1 hypothetical protein UFOVP1421_173 [uncultured Caudovirales phage]CAB5238679.1 hypothetical protein UFOVP1525_183 [uncultured Caudovirales phage]